MNALDIIALAALQAMSVTPDSHERATVIVCEQERCAALPDSRQNEGNFRLHVSLRPGERIAAILHTHPSDHVAWDRSEEFSPEDREMANHLGVPSYVYFAKLKQVRVYEPRFGERLISGVVEHAVTDVTSAASADRGGRVTGATEPVRAGL